MSPLVSRLILKDFRTYPALDLAVSRGLVALVGENGAGKTNLIEALSLFAPGRGLRRADRIAVLREGRVEELGTHQELLARDGRYAHLFRLQASGYVS